MRKPFKDVIRYLRGFVLSRPKIDDNTNYAARGSRNVLFMGQAKPRPFKGMDLVGGTGGIYGTPAGAITPLPPVLFPPGYFDDPGCIVNMDVVEQVDGTFMIRCTDDSASGIVQFGYTLNKGTITFLLEPQSRNNGAQYGIYETWSNVCGNPVGSPSIFVLQSTENGSDDTHTLQTFDGPVTIEQSNTSGVPDVPSLTAVYRMVFDRDGGGYVKVYKDDTLIHTWAGTMNPTSNYHLFVSLKTNLDGRDFVSSGGLTHRALIYVLRASAEIWTP